MPDTLLLDDPQRRAADPRRSAFVTANAGSGKTKTLIDRVARLLLAGVRPETILCVTYTKAAAAEMQRRLFGRLGGWSVLADDALGDSLSELLGDGAQLDHGDLSRARALFAQALETPGGLKIQTIHAFCEKLLRRFPLEAKVSPGFRVMDDPAAAAVAAAARKAVARHALKGEGPVAEAYARFSVALDFASFHAMFAAFEARRGALAVFLKAQGDDAAAWAWAACGLEPGCDPERLEAEALAALDTRLWNQAADVLAQGGVADQKNALRLRAVAAEPSLTGALAALFIDGGEGTPVAWVFKTGALKAHEPLRAGLLDEQDRLAIVRERLRGARVAADTAGALTLAAAYLEAYRIEKESAGALDFADLVEKTCALLADSPAAAWVLYKLDGGVDHILVDEAQDTAPEQWTIVRALTGEFFAGAGVALRADLQRTVFVVGDEKQSIYSFQGADPARLREETAGYIARIAAAGRDGEVVPLVDSWRSTLEVLSFVDVVFEAGVPPNDGPLAHVPRRDGHHGCVDVWPLMREPKGEDRGAWDAPLDAEGEESANRRLAQAIACEIGDLIARGDAVYDKDLRVWRPATAGDVLILVRRRGALFEDILRALKQAGLPVGGADRLSLSGHIAFDDLMALARFALFPADDLTLAALLRSPFCDVDDEGLYRLAKGRPASLWDALQARAGEDAAWAASLAFLQTVMATSRTRRPFEFFRLALIARDAAGRSMRARLLRRLGREAEDALDEFLAQILAAEARGIEDLESLVAAFASLDIVVKREMEAGRDEVRVMTAHGAKGLEAPIVFLPEAALQSAARGSPLLETEDGGVLWCTAKAADCVASAAARERRAAREDAEAQRLLYVALTRARDRLVICGRLAANRQEQNLKGWWEKIAAAFGHDHIAPRVREAACGMVVARRYGPDPEVLGPAAWAAAPAAAAPAWLTQAAPAQAYARYASPSQIGAVDDAPAPSPLARQGGLGRFRRGDLIHRLLQLLPDIPEAGRIAAAQALLDRERGLTDAQRAEMITAAFSVLEDARFARVFGPGGRAEVAVAGTSARLPAGLAVSGRIDRLVVLPDRVLVVDFKTNRPSPAVIADADPAYVRQMAIYAAVLGEVFPDRAIEAALVWTDGPKLMAVPENLMAQALAELGRTG
ncbi:double-strand break repair helicase AddA [Phenylobacterium sp.]|jgi:ATP-dependent helicase/nuclease subunit A|uniref:double-strand break repair helicase AddA n=1 Tax=Phenylobacterium sp. TaxID=1871053 RepID=UPI002F405688